MPAIVFLTAFAFSFAAYTNAAPQLWNTWATQPGANERHDGFLFPSEKVQLQPSKLPPAPTWQTTLLESQQEPLTPTNMVFANNMIFVAVGNEVFAISPSTGAIAWKYVVIGTSSLIQLVVLGNVSQASNNLAIGAITKDNVLEVLDSDDGNLIQSKAIPLQDSYNIVLVGTPDASMFTTDGGSTLFDWNVNSDMIAKAIGNGGGGVYNMPTLCGSTNEFVFVSGNCGTTSAYQVVGENMPGLKHMWTWTSSCSGSASQVPACVRTGNNSYYVIISSADTSQNVCFLLDVYGTGKLQASFSCIHPPIVHYNETSGVADIAIFDGGVTNQIVATQIEGKNFMKKELWVGKGSTIGSVIVGNFLFTVVQGTFSNVMAVYNVLNGETVWTYGNSSISDTNTFEMSVGYGADMYTLAVTYADNYGINMIGFRF